MKKNLKTIVEITEREYIKNDVIKSYKEDSIYVVKFITTYDLYIMGVFVKTCSNEKTVPFSFLSIDAAKEFCSICPTFKSKSLYSPDGVMSSYDVTYETYKLTCNNSEKSIVYVVWDKQSLNSNTSGSIVFSPTKHYPAIKGYAKNIKIKKWINTYSVDDVKYENFSSNLSDLIKLPNAEQDVLNTWRYELIAQ